MPTFHNLEVTATVDVDFEVYCSCGAGLCNATDTRASRTRSFPQAVVDPCERCIDEAKDAQAERISELEFELAELREQLQAQQ